MSATRAAGAPPSTWLVAAMFGAALLAFWPGYLARLPSGPDPYTHVHAILMTLWMALLLAQPWLIRAGHRALHRRLGQLTYALAPAIVVSAVLLAHARFGLMDAATFAVEGRFLYLPLAMTLLFAIAWGLGVAFRRRAALHGRFMLATLLALVDPVVARLQYRAFGLYDNLLAYQAVSFVVADLALVLLIALDRRRGVSNPAFPVMAAIFLAIQVAWFSVGQSSAWLAFCRWFVALPLT